MRTAFWAWFIVFMGFLATASIQQSRRDTVAKVVQAEVKKSCKISTRKCLRK